MTARPMLPVFIFLGLGIAVYDWIDLLPLIGVAFLALGWMAAGWWFKQKWTLWLAVVCLGYVLAAHDAIRPADDISRFYLKDRDVVVQGVVISDVEVRKVFRTNKKFFYLKFEKVFTDRRWKTARGTVAVNSFHGANIRFGRRLIAAGRLHPPYDFDERSSYSEYLKRRHVERMLTIGKTDRVVIVQESVFSPVRMFFRHLHHRWGEEQKRYLSPAEAGIMTAMMTGDRSGIPPQIKQLFVETGTVHILAISGLNMAIIAGVFLFTAGLLPLGLRSRVFVCGLMVVAYALVTDAGASVVRAAIMAAVVLAGIILEREQDGLNTLALSGVAILIFQPWQIFDLGFQLTFLCVWAILAVHPLVKSHVQSLWRRWRPAKRFSQPEPAVFLDENQAGFSWADAVGISVTVWIVVAGLILYHFQIVTPVTILANLAIVPMTTGLIIAGMALAFTGVCCPWLCPAAAIYVKLILNAMIGVIHLCRRLPGACWTVEGFSIRHLAAYFLMLTVVLLLLYRLRPRRRRLI